MIAYLRSGLQQTIESIPIKDRNMKTMTIVLLMFIFTISAYAQGHCSAYCLDVRTLSNPKTKQSENHFNRSPLIKASNFKKLISKCQSNYGTALVLAYKFKKSNNSSSILTGYKSAKAETACKSI